jgi:LmbE family N-acetylglucosaminyl deacetylase
MIGRRSRSSTSWAWRVSAVAGRRPTLLVVHAHPDDEASSTGGVLARYSSEGFRTVLVTCTDGRCGDGPGGVKPGDPGHDPAAVAAMRRAELAESVAILGISDVELLGYADSGMMGWASNDAPGAFWATPVGEAAGRVAALLRRYRPDVVVTYDENGFYGHPDHIQANRVTMRALELLKREDAPAKAYWITIPHATMNEFAMRMRANGADWDLIAGEQPQIGLPDGQITTWVDIREFAERKYRALAAHASQPDNAFFLTLNLATFTDLLGTETFLRVRDSTSDRLARETDLFTGLR